MRICQLELSNLASIEGPECIDFTAEPLVNAGVFAITGPTGSGKSTLLDAICLALYDQTPRYSKARELSVKIVDVPGGDSIAQNDVRAILRDGSSEGYAKLTFIATNGGTYRSTWSVSRARKKADGKLQTSKLVLEQLGKPGAVWEKKTEVIAQVEQLIGLNFEQFTRAVLLAQGDFTAFLKANQTEKAALLEKLTGTTIYTQISQMVHQRYTQANNALQNLRMRLGDIAFLPEEEIAAITEQVQLLEGESKQILTQQQENQAALATYAAHEHWQLEYQLWEKQQQQLVQQEQELHPIKEQLSQRDLVAPQLNLFQQWRSNHAQWQSHEQQLAEWNTQLEQAATEVERLRHELHLRTTAVEQAEKSIREAQPALTQAIELDKMIEIHQKQWEDLSGKQRDILTQLSQQTQRLAELNQQIKHEAAAQLAVRQQLSDSEHISSWLPQAARLEKEMRQWETYQHEWRTLSLLLQKQQDQASKLRTDYTVRVATIEELKVALQPLEQQKNQLLEQLEMAKQIDDLAIVDQQLQAVQRGLELAAAREENRKRLAEIQVELTRTDTEIAQLEEQRTVLQREIETARIQAETALTLQQNLQLSQQEVVVELRKHLHAGSPCSVCGSTEHPFADAAYASWLETQQQQVKAYELAYAKANAAWNQWQLQGQLTEQKQKDWHKQLQDITQKNAETDAHWANWLMQHPDLWKGDVSHLHDQLIELQQRKQNALEQQQQLARWSNELRSTEQQWQKSQKQLQLAEQEISQVEAEIAQLDTAIHHAKTQTERIAHELHAIESYVKALPGMQSYDPSQWKWENFQQAIVAYTQLQQQNEKLTVLLNELQQQLQLLEKDESQARSDYQQCNEELTVLTTALNQEKAARAQLFNGLSVSQVQLQLDAHSAKAREAQQQARLLLDQEERNQLQIHTLYLQVEKESKQLQTQQQTALATLQKFVADHGLPWNRAVELWALTDRDLNQLRHHVQDWQTAYAQHIGREEGLRKRQAQLIEQLNGLLPKSEIELALQQVEAQWQQIQTQAEQLRYQLIEQAQLKQKQADLLAAIETQQKQTEPWAQLEQLIGSQDGAKFRKIAQEFTLDYLIDYANVHLEQLNARYTLQRIPETLGLQICDRDMGDEIRSVYSLSGGESFLVSLALALGLSSLTAHRMRVEFLFIDEGFGTLDPDTLALAVDVLERLQQQGKKVGIISHVAELTERLTTQIRVEKGTHGKARLQVLGY